MEFRRNDNSYEVAKRICHDEGLPINLAEALDSNINKVLGFLMS